jgi:hypothetical protein
MTFARRNVSEMAVFNLHETIIETVSLLEHTLGKKVTIKTDLCAETTHSTATALRYRICCSIWPSTPAMPCPPAGNYT